ncbi:hypothetical protein ACFVZ3_30305 [Kitasatospora purpeofusca]|uniref:hypothetical protein n=1 Tax=Kitasatospora purpeofusca TaxID=67352 RepID=UPI00369C53B7
MCGRFVSTTGPIDPARLLDVSTAVSDTDFTPSWNVGTTRDALTVLMRPSMTGVTTESPSGTTVLPHPNAAGLPADQR